MLPFCFLERLRYRTGAFKAPLRNRSFGVQIVLSLVHIVKLPVDFGQMGFRLVRNGPEIAKRLLSKLAFDLLSRLSRQLRART